MLLTLSQFALRRRLKLKKKRRRLRMKLLKRRRKTALTLSQRLLLSRKDQNVRNLVQMMLPLQQKAQLLQENHLQLQFQPLLKRLNRSRWLYLKKKKMRMG